MPQYDVILAGAGLANGLIALRLRQQRPELRILLIEAHSEPGAHHTWSFHAEDLSEAQHQWVAPLVAHRWQSYDVRFPQRQRRLRSGYFCVTAERFAQVIRATFASDLLLNTPVSGLTAHTVTLADGRVLEAAAVIDGRGYQPDSTLRMGFQSFVGQEWQLTEPHGLTAPIIMDATVDQQAGYRFVYCLPFSARTLLIEDTHYINNATLDSARARQNIRDYAAQQGWQFARLLREEQGALPITLTGDVDAFWQKRALPCSGLRAGLFHPTTGYSLPLAVALADRLAQVQSLSTETLHAAIGQFARHTWQQQRFFRMLNRMLFLAGPADQRWQVMQRFYGLPEGLIARFYAGKLTLPDRLRILSGKPPVPVLAAIQAIMTPHRQQAMQ